MDEQVIAAMARWPDVPAVYGWLSLTETGQWRLHPQGDAIRQPGSPGEEITSPQILDFISRNYDADEAGQWYFQNGPQRVYVRLDAAPFIVHTTVDPSSARLKLRTHTGLDIQQLHSLHIDETGRLYAATDRAAVLVAGRDLPELLNALESTPDQNAAGHADAHDALSHCMETGQTVWLQSNHVQGFPTDAIAVHFSPSEALESLLRFRRIPVPNPGEAGHSPVTPGFR